MYIMAVYRNLMYTFFLMLNRLYFKPKTQFLAFEMGILFLIKLINNNLFSKFK